jgi:hypothetical protein
MILLLTYPVSQHLNLFQHGVRAEGIVSSGGFITIDDNVQTYRVIHYVVDGVEYSLKGPLNVRYSFDSKCKIIYNKKDPTDCIIPSFLYLYTSETAMYCGFIFIVCVAFYTSFRPTPKQNQAEATEQQYHDFA